MSAEDAKRNMDRLIEKQEAQGDEIERIISEIGKEEMISRLRSHARRTQPAKASLFEMVMGRPNAQAILTMHRNFATVNLVAFVDAYVEPAAIMLPFTEVLTEYAKNGLLGPGMLGPQIKEKLLDLLESKGLSPYRVIRDKMILDIRGLQPPPTSSRILPRYVPLPPYVPGAPRSSSPDEKQFNESRQFARKEVAAAYGLKMNMLDPDPKELFEAFFEARKKSSRENGLAFLQERFYFMRHDHPYPYPTAEELSALYEQACRKESVQDAVELMQRELYICKRAASAEKRFIGVDPASKEPDRSVMTSATKGANGEYHFKITQLHDPNSLE